MGPLSAWAACVPLLLSALALAQEGAQLQGAQLLEFKVRARAGKRPGGPGRRRPN